MVMERGRARPATARTAALLHCCTACVLPVSRVSCSSACLSHLSLSLSLSLSLNLIPAPARAHGRGRPRPAPPPRPPAPAPSPSPTLWTWRRVPSA